MIWQCAKPALDGPKRQSYAPVAHEATRRNPRSAAALHRERLLQRRPAMAAPVLLDELNTVAAELGIERLHNEVRT
jgi:hypothetical protein